MRDVAELSSVVCVLLERVARLSRAPPPAATRGARALGVTSPCVLESCAVEPSGLGPGFGMAASLVAALTWTLLTLVARTLATHFSALSLNIVRSAAGSVVLVPIALVAGTPGRWPGPLPSWFFLWSACWPRLESGTPPSSRAPGRSGWPGP